MKNSVMFLLLLLLLLTVIQFSSEEEEVKTFYAKENGSIVLSWGFAGRADASSKDLFIICDRTTDDKVLFLLRDGVKNPKSQSSQFTGRVHCFLDGSRLSCNISRVTTNDSGSYRCELRKYHENHPTIEVVATLVLNVTQTLHRENTTSIDDKLKPEDPKDPQRRDRWIDFPIIAAVVVVVVAVVVLVFKRCHQDQQEGDQI